MAKICSWWPPEIPAVQGDELFAAAFLLFLLALAVRFLLPHSHSALKRPPVVKGLPLLGSVLDLGRDPAGFISRCHEQYGDVFTLKLATQRMTFLMDPSLFPVFFNSPDTSVTFRPAVEQFTARVFGLPSSIFFPHHFNMLQSLRSLLSPATISPLLLEILKRFDAQLDSLPSAGQVDLVELLKKLTFTAALDTLFGEAFGKRHGHSALLRHFSTFEWEFEKAASPIPHIFQPQFRKSRRALLEAFRTSIAAGDFDGPEVAPELLRNVPLPRSLQPNVLLAVIWAAQSNTIPAIFWAISFLLLPQHATHLGRVRAQVEECIAHHTLLPDSVSTLPSPTSHAEDSKGKTTSAAPQPAFSQEMKAHARASLGHERAEEEDDAMSQHDNSSKSTYHTARQSTWKGGGGADDSSIVESGPCAESVYAGCMRAALDKHGALALCVSESLRLRSQGIEIRVAAAPLILPNFTIPKGDILALSPFEAHHDSALYEDAQTFDPQRWIVAPDTTTTTVNNNNNNNKDANGRDSGPSKQTPPVNLSFGGGKYRCPGRFFAEAEMGAIVALFFTRLRSALASDYEGVVRSTTAGERRGASCCSGDPGGDLPRADASRLVGVKAPIGPCIVEYRKR